MPDKKETTAFGATYGVKQNNTRKCRMDARSRSEVARHPTTRQSRYHNSISKESCQKYDKLEITRKVKIQGYWIKNVSSLHERLAWQLQSVVEGNIPEWISQAGII